MKKNLKLLDDKTLLRKNSKSFLKKIALGSLLMFGTSLGGTYYLYQQMEAFEPEKFPNEKIVLNGYSVSKKYFYNRLKEEDGVWYYTDHEGNDINLYEATDFRNKADLSFRSFKNVPVTTVVDTVGVKRNSKNNAIMYAYATHDSLQNLPSLGFHDYGKIVIRHFVSKDPQLNQKYQIYNDEYNCTWRHEYQHYLNAKAGIARANQTYETKFAECCMDEVSANIAQLLEQRKNYLQTGDVNRLTNRFKFYRQWVLTQPQPLPETINQEEQKFIANGVVDMWKKCKFNLYETRNFKRVKYYMHTVDYNACVNRKDEHEQLMRDMFEINGMDFYQYIHGRENEFSDMLSQAHKQECAKLTEIKKNKMQYIEKVGQFTNNDNAQKDKYFRGLKAKNDWNKFKKILDGR